MHILQFDLDELNIGHLALHGIALEEAEQAVRNRPLDLSSELRNGEERVSHIGERMRKES